MYTNPTCGFFILSSISIWQYLVKLVQMFHFFENVQGFSLMCPNVELFTGSHMIGHLDVSHR